MSETPNNTDKIDVAPQIIGAVKDVKAEADKLVDPLLNEEHSLVDRPDYLGVGRGRNKAFISISGKIDDGNIRISNHLEDGKTVIFAPQDTEARVFVDGKEIEPMILTDEMKFDLASAALRRIREKIESVSNSQEALLAKR
jgi:hypothetical protein